MFFGFVVHT